MLFFLFLDNDILTLLVIPLLICYMYVTATFYTRIDQASNWANTRARAWGTFIDDPCLSLEVGDPFLELQGLEQLG